MAKKEKSGYTTMRTMADRVAGGEGERGRQETK